MADDPHLATLRQLQGTRGPGLFPCIEDLVLHGLDPGRFGQGEARPTRQDVAQYVAAWLRHAGLAGDLFCTTWFTGYCVARLAAISSSSPSQIRHSAKSTLKYVLRSEVPFVCHQADNPFTARCTTGCPRRAAGPIAAVGPLASAPQGGGATASPMEATTVPPADPPRRRGRPKQVR